MRVRSFELNGVNGDWCKIVGEPVLVNDNGEVLLIFMGLKCVLGVLATFAIWADSEGASTSLKSDCRCVVVSCLGESFILAKRNNSMGSIIFDRFTVKLLDVVSFVFPVLESTRANLGIPPPSGATSLMDGVETNFISKLLSKVRLMVSCILGCSVSTNSDAMSLKTSFLAHIFHKFASET
ncbi:hypothetical protein FF38_06132 [Lucilia cuprina]|uniref:Uncharacterized protein n=1 Tax=Lucilia cuprina TaxID=7375 RepID=A0A0L0C944_LUCCU|nr:hypothetical protein FF38_06132 [Lucilia cuprina]